MFGCCGATSSRTKLPARSRIICCSSEKSSGVKMRSSALPPNRKLDPPAVREWSGILPFVGCGNVAIADELVLVDHQPVDTDRPTGVSPIRADAHLGAEPVAV